MNNKGTEYERGGAGKDMRPKQVESGANSNRTLKALQMTAEWGDDAQECIQTAQLVIDACRASLGGYEPRRERFYRLKTLAAIIAIAVTSIGLYEAGEKGIGIGVEAYKGPPFVYGSARFVNDVVEEGGSLEVIASHKFLRACNWSTTRKWFHDGKMIATSEVHLPPITASPELMARRWVIELPAGLKPGDYDFKSVLHATCGDETWQDEIFEQNFQVVAKKQPGAKI